MEGSDTRTRGVDQVVGGGSLARGDSPGDVGISVGGAEKKLLFLFVTQVLWDTGDRGMMFLNVFFSHSFCP